MRWRVRRAGPDDASALALVASATFLETYATELAGADIVAHCLNNTSVELFTRWTTDRSTIVTIAEHAPGHAPIGYAVLTAPDFPIDTRLTDVELRRIYILAQMQGTGLGKALMTRAFEDAAAAGHGRVLLGVYEHNYRAHAFYERLGFTRIGERRFTVGTATYTDPVYARDV
ncbi:GNAT family N-acetyltransferase [Sphingomonas ginsenosidivorax]|uniref:GNAT family N-acetyltransferase n=1 Tax=Sphingomonas ginsenosidivorax TaxID=862135 RepID=A0A5C6UDN8_9SPHN|nr:GNAT family N-acetyltransferase [Sphingomonas ginsenosidivorax]TXC70510.1 GNAT family N-acetyltransferase [Sphingomonas ginsenosidivorax]